MNVTVYTWTGKESLTLENDSLILYWMKTKRIIPLAQVISFDIKEPKSSMRPGMITVRLAGTSGDTIRLTSFFSTGNSNNIDFPHAYEYAKEAREMQKYIASYRTGTSASQPAISQADEIKKYKELLDVGAITQDEYDEKKKCLLGLG